MIMYEIASPDDNISTNSELEALQGGVQHNHVPALTGYQHIQYLTTLPVYLLRSQYHVSQCLLVDKMCKKQKQKETE